MADNQLKVLQIGAGSMGTRRLRDLSKRPDVVLALHDTRQDRLARAHERFGVATFPTLERAMAWRPDALVISTPPDQHMPYIELALRQGLHHFCEANLWTHDHRTVESESQAKGLVSAPSASMHFLPVVRELKRVVADELGVLHSYQMALSVWMPGWHADEGAEFYARHRTTAAGREMVPFELLWLNEVFGPPAAVCGSVTRRGQLACDSEDTWCLQMDLAAGGHGQLAVWMASPRLCRAGRAAGSNGMLDFDLATGEIRRQLDALGIDDTLRLGAMADVLEAAYLAEIHTFIDAVHGRTTWPHAYAASSLATATLAAAERSAQTGRWEDVDTLRQPDHLPSPGPPARMPLRRESQAPNRR